MLVVGSGYRIFFQPHFGLILNVGFHIIQIVSKLEGMIGHVIGLIYCECLLRCDPYILTSTLLNPQFVLLHFIFEYLQCLFVE
jgi:hypothetical protein